MDLFELKIGEMICLWIINGLVFFYFWFYFVVGKMWVVVVDGIEVEFIEVDKLLIVMVEIYDIEVSLLVEEGVYEFWVIFWDCY